MLYTVYILYSEPNQKIYIGYTSNLLTRFHSHNEWGHDWTKRWRPWIVIHTEYFSEKLSAMKREKELKSAAAREMIWEKIKTGFMLAGYISM